MTLRIEKAKEILKNSPDCYVKDVAEQVGYVDQLYFSRVFKAMTGVSPSDYAMSYHQK